MDLYKEAGKTFLLWARINIIVILHISMLRVGFVIKEK